MKEVLINNSIDERKTHLVQDRFLLLGSTSIKNTYETLKTEIYNDSEAELTMAWLALLSGDNLGLYQRYQSIDSSKLNPRSLGLYYDLQALSGVFGTPEERLKKSEDAIKLLEGISDLYLANAYLTHGQILNGIHHLRDASSYFKKAYLLFFQHQLYFPASVSLTNALLDQYRLGDIRLVIQTVEQTLMITSQFQIDDQRLWDIIRLPYGMCLLQKGLYSLAENELILAKEMIDHYQLVHMHGYIEIELTKLYTITKQKEKLLKLYHDMKKLFSNMHYPMMDVIMYYASYHLEILTQVEIDKLIFYFENDKVMHPLINELMMALHHDQKLTLPLEKHIQKINDARYMGDLTELIQYLLFLGDRYLDLNQKKEATVILEEVYELYKMHQLGLSLKLYIYQSSNILKRIDPKLDMKEIENLLLTSKELEIIRLIEKGLTNDEIASTLFISVGTVKWHINHIYSKIGVKHRAEAIKKAKDLKII